jgi:hypothetical protein
LYPKRQEERRNAYKFLVGKPLESEAVCRRLTGERRI